MSARPGSVKTNGSLRQVVGTAHAGRSRPVSAPLHRQGKDAENARRAPKREAQPGMDPRRQPMRTLNRQFSAAGVVNRQTSGPVVNAEAASRPMARSTSATSLRARPKTAPLPGSSDSRSMARRTAPKHAAPPAASTAFRSDALQLEVSLTERLHTWQQTSQSSYAPAAASPDRSAPRDFGSSAGVDSRFGRSAPAETPQQASATPAPAKSSKLAIYRELFEEVIERDKVFGSLLRKIKRAYDVFIDEHIDHKPSAEQVVDQLRGNIFGTPMSEVEHLQQEMEILRSQAAYAQHRERYLTETLRANGVPVDLDSIPAPPLGYSERDVPMDGLLHPHASNGGRGGAHDMAKPQYRNGDPPGPFSGLDDESSTVMGSSHPSTNVCGAPHQSDGRSAANFSIDSERSGVSDSRGGIGNLSSNTRSLPTTFKRPPWVPALNLASVHRAESGGEESMEDDLEDLPELARC
mmetsp:Transcript_133785/g.303446  ORF Transcript_133785/g.303446 Transcript_133785/m.303446 type:complete len:465 (+) Transcript_133785:100-1494(+)